MESISKKNKWCYSTGCIGRDMTYTLVSLFLLVYVQYTVDLTNIQFLVISIAMVLCRVWDAVNDPMMGTIITNTRSKFGKYRLWVLIGAVSNAIVLVLMFTVRLEGWAYVGVFSLLYLLWGMTFTMNDVSYWSLLPALAQKKKERDVLTTLVAVFASVGAFIVGGLVPILTTGNAITAYRNFAIIIAIIFVLCQLMVFLFVKEKTDESENPKEKITLKKMFQLIFQNKQLLWMALVVLGYSLGSALLNAFGQNFFYVEFGYDGSLMTIFTVVYAVGTLVSQSMYSKLASKFKRNQMIKISMASLILGYLLFFIVGIIPFSSALAMVKLIILCIVGMLIFCGQGIFYMNMLVMLANTIEYDQWQTGVRNESIIFSIRPFMVKLAGAIQQLIVSVVLILTGIKTISNGIASLEQSGISTDSVKEQATGLLEEVTYWQKFGLIASMTLIPIVLFIICWIIIKKRYIITEDFYEQILKEIDERKIATENN